MPNAVKVCDEGGMITASSATSPVTVQFGKGAAWNAPVTLGANALPLYVYYTNPVLGGDPASGVTKELDVQQKATAYTVTCKGTDGKSTVVNVPALPVPTITVPAPVFIYTAASESTKGSLLMNCSFQLATSTAGREYYIEICDNPPK